jgi:lipoprotein-anchoring transpeptidase ErfK/SrfK
MRSRMRTGRLVGTALTVVALVLAGACGPAPARSESSAAAAARQARDDASRDAWAALTRLQGARGGSDWAPYLHLFATARDARGFLALSVDWTREAMAADLARRFLEQRSGGVQDGAPADLARLAAVLDQAAARAAGAGVVTDPAPAARGAFEGYRQLEVDAQVERHDTLRDSLQSAVDLVNGRADGKARALELVAGLDELVNTAKTVGVPESLNQLVADAKVLAPSAATDAEVRTALEKAQGATDTLNAIIYRTDTAPLPPCLSYPSRGQFIWLHLATQQLVAYQDGCPLMAMPITTGRPALPTDRGTFRIFYKAPAYKMVSPWPPGSPFWYPSTWVYYAMEFVYDGTFIHNADWQPDDTYGPGSQYGPYASHGCIHVQDGPLAKLYAWAQLGAVVTVSD